MPTPTTDTDQPAWNLHGARLTSQGAWFAGVCASLGRASPVPAWAWRAGFIAITPLKGLGVVLYAACVVLMPREPVEAAAITMARAIARPTARLRRWYRRTLAGKDW